MYAFAIYKRSLEIAIRFSEIKYSDLKNKILLKSINRKISRSQIAGIKLNKFVRFLFPLKSPKTLKKLRFYKNSLPGN